MIGHPDSSGTAEFYVAGGTLLPNAPCYVERSADRALLKGLLSGDYCWVLTSRQMGKSSLMVRTACRLREAGIDVVTLDLSGLGRPASAEQWYRGLLRQIGRQLGIVTGIQSYWDRNEQLAPMQRFTETLREVVLTASEKPVVLFVDEVDAVRSLPFPVDEFFAGIRECFNRRGEDPIFQRLTFCLLGVASPVDLISDLRVTPFNIGRRIELTDFSLTEVLPLARQLTGAVSPEQDDGSIAAVVARRILYWTGGQPYLTLSLFQALAEGTAQEWRPRESRCVTAKIDLECRKLFLAVAPHQQNINLPSVAARLLHSTLDRAGLLETYARVRRGRRVPAREEDPIVATLRLSGIVGEQSGWLCRRNRIYDRVFDSGWIKQHMPGPELRRQRRAFCRGALIVGTCLALLWTWTARLQSLSAEREAQFRRKLHYASQVNLAYQALDAGNAARAWELLQAQNRPSEEEDLRGFEWRYLWRRFHEGVRHTLRGHQRLVFSVSYSPDGRILATASFDHTVRLWDAWTGQLRYTLAGHQGEVMSEVFSPDGKTVASCSLDGTVRFWDTATGDERSVLRIGDGGVNSLAYSPSGQWLATGGRNGTIRIWDLAGAKPRLHLSRVVHSNSVERVVFAPDGGELVSVGADAKVSVWDTAAGRQLALLQRGQPKIDCVAFSPDGKTLAGGGSDGQICLWETHTWHRYAEWTGHENVVNAVTFSRDGRYLATASWDQTAKVWDPTRRRAIRTLTGHTDMVNSVAFSPDGRMLATAGNDRTAILWDLTRHRESPVLADQGQVRNIALSCDGQLLASGSEIPLCVRLRALPSGTEIHRFNSMRISPGSFSPDGHLLALSDATTGDSLLWDLIEHRWVGRFRTSDRGLSCLAFSPDGQVLAVGKKDGRVGVWSVPERRIVASYQLQGDLVRRLEFTHRDDKLIAAAGNRVFVLRWDGHSLGPGPTLAGHGNVVTALAISPDGKWIASGSWDRTLVIWDAYSFQKVGSYRAHRDPLLCAVFSPDSRTLVTGDEGRTFKLWNVATMEEVAVFKQHERGASAAAFAPDGNTLVTGNWGGIVRFWRASPLAAIDPPNSTYNTAHSLLVTVNENRAAKRS